MGGQKHDQFDDPDVLAGQKRDWQRWSVIVLGLFLIGVGFGIHSALQGVGQPSVSALLPPLIYGIFAGFVLLNFYIAQKQAVLKGLEQEMIQQRIEAELNRELALLDAVTEVYNRRYLRILLSKEVSRAKRYSQGLAVLMVDITGFRRVNESLGHTGGDVVLRQIAHVIKMRIRNSDYVVRFGSDEFLLILPDTDPENAQMLGGRLRDAFTAWCIERGMAEFRLRLAVGMASYSPTQPVEDMVKLAEQRMLQDRVPAETVTMVKGSSSPARS